MNTNSFKIGVVCASSRFAKERAEAVEAWMAHNHPDRDVAVVFHPACFLKHGHFAGDDASRLSWLAEVELDDADATLPAGMPVRVTFPDAGRAE